MAFEGEDELHRYKYFTILVLLFLVVGLNRVAMGQTGENHVLGAVPLVNAHAHNDYEHVHPLWDALAQGFCSVEADIHLVDGQLLVAHDRKAVKPERTLQALYLDPMRELVRKNHGHLYPTKAPCTLLIDIKSDGEAVWPVLKKVLGEYREMLTEFNGTHKKERAITVILSGSRPDKTVPKEKVRLAALDGHLDELDSGMDATLIPWVSASWSEVSRWNGAGEMPDEQRAKVEDIVARAHKHGYRVRFWATPDNVGFWRTARKLGIDLLNADDLEGCSKFLRAEIEANSNPGRR